MSSLWLKECQVKCSMMFLFPPFWLQWQQDGNCTIYWLDVLQEHRTGQTYLLFKRRKNDMSISYFNFIFIFHFLFIPLCCTIYFLQQEKNPRFRESGDSDDEEDEQKRQSWSHSHCWASTDTSGHFCNRIESNGVQIWMWTTWRRHFLYSHFISWRLSFRT